MWMAGLVRVDRAEGGTYFFCARPLYGAQTPAYTHGEARTNHVIFYPFIFFLSAGPQDFTQAATPGLLTASQALNRMAAVGWRNLSLVDAKVVAPYAVAFAAIPTLAAASGREHYPPWPVLPLSTTTLLNHFTFVRAKLPARWWSLLSSAFTHLDANHRDRCPRATKPLRLRPRCNEGG